MVIKMEFIKGNIKTLYILIVVWLLALLFSAVMFTMSLIYDVFISLIISSVTGVLSCVGIFYTGYMIIKIKTRLTNLDN